ncbi:MAG: hypothetical protein KID00_08485 [Clostridium argentinense]|uniref:Na+-transporting methylmalonyl-CoA/oxaloacetate decarboxylase subunit beta n=1 Tax=Clostridium faecium TaxID=2762223 RepID=A0ABR8YQT3_9CLOT|nr:Na+-transporting methylmalonyl-CoA/oxaloacetate decarboxylase subunit beta [Clostridium faecium]MBD8046254.1 Na+-transporting methylmalonyl-CoA/oxaloacetate decarboxylase subunit beta [Clostridium faecium]MBS5823885.1 hypothetical protein [Clostridium argentinense]MDU1350723.1 hypothetical protein [Clostridium argentinense]
MKVYYNSNMRSSEKGLGGFRQRVNWQFEFNGAKRYIPVVYRFPKGIVFDIITILDETKLREFFEKYKDIEETLTPLQERCAEEEHPYHSVSIKKIWINGKEEEGGYSSSGTVNAPWEQDDTLIPIQKAYSHILKDNAYFACSRFCVPYPKSNSKLQKILRFFRLYKVKTIKIVTYPVKNFLPLDIHFEIPVDKNQKEISFNHPLTGTTHKIYFQNPELIEFPASECEKHSFYVMQLTYEIYPELQQGDTLEFTSSMKYTETKTSEEKFSPTSTSSFGIIGGACGPTAIFISSKEKDIPKGLHGLPLYSCFSVPSFEKKDIGLFILEGINIETCNSKEYNFQ